MNWPEFGQTIDTLKASVERMIYNAGTMFAFFAQYVSSVPQDATWSYRKEDGTIEDKSVPNTVKFRNALWDDVGGALGQFNRTFYVDAVNGSDTNDGSSGSPFASLAKAFDSTPIGGKVVVNIVGKYVNTTHSTNIGDNKKIYLIVNDNACYEAVMFDYNSDYIGIPSILVGTDSSIRIYVYNTTDDMFPVKFKVTNPDGVATAKPLAPYNDGLFEYIGGNSGKSTINIISRTQHADTVLFDIYKGYLFSIFGWNADYGSLPVLTGGLSHYTGKFAVLTDGAKLLQVKASAIYNPQGAIVDGNGDSTSYKDAISGVIYDADSGNPVNVLSNINLSN